MTEEWDPVEVLAESPAVRGTELPETVETLEEGRVTYLSDDGDLRIALLDGYGNYKVEYRGLICFDVEVITSSHPIHFFYIPLQSERFVVYRYSLLDNSLEFSGFEKAKNSISSTGMALRAALLGVFTGALLSFMMPIDCGGGTEDGTEQIEPKNDKEDDGNGVQKPTPKNAPVYPEDIENDGIC